MQQTPVTRLAGERKSSEACGIQATADCALPKPIPREGSKSGRRRGQYSARGDGDYRRSSNTNTQAAMQHTAKRCTAKNRKSPSSSDGRRWWRRVNTHAFRVGNVNVTTVKDDAKVVQCAVACRQLGHKLCFWSESHKIGFGVQDQWPAAARLEGGKLIWSGLKQKAQAGVGLLLAEDVELVGAPEEVVPGRILFARVKWRGTQLATWSVYAPTNAQADTAKHEFFRTLSRSLDEMKKRYPKYARLCVGDFNATLGTDAPRSSYIGPNLDSYHTTDNGLRLAELLANHGAYALNTLFIPKKPSHRVTWKLGRGKKRLDYFVTDKFLRLCCTNARVYPQQSAPFETNHFLCAADFRLPTKGSAKTSLQTS